jgi:P-type conjugative transfer protein TrbJ
LRTCALLAIAASLALTPVAPANALAVFDGANFGQNLMTAIRTLQMINNQIRQLQNEARMLVNMAKHLRRLDYSAAVQIRTALGQIGGLMRRAEGIVFDIAQIEREYARLFPEEYTAAITTDDLVRDARQRWQYARKAFAHTLTVQAQVVNAVEADGFTLDRLIAASQAAAGSLQAQQAGNQLVALSAKQQLQTQQLLAAQYRAEALERARQVAAEATARARFQRFIGDGRAYTRRQ